MKKFVGMALLAGLAVAALVVGSLTSTAQNAPAPPPGQPGPGGQAGPGGPGMRGGRGNFDPAQMRTMMMQRMKEQLAATDDEWKAIEPLVTNVMEKQAAARTGGGIGGFMGGRRGGPGGPGGGPQPADQGPGGNRGGGRGGFGPASNPEVEALQKAIDAKAPAKEIEARLKALRDARVKREEDLKKAREELRKVLTITQEAQLVLVGILD